MKTNPFVRGLAAAFVFLTLSALPAQTAKNEKSRIAVFGFTNNSGDETFDTPTATATDNLVFSLRMIGLYDVFRDDTVRGPLTAAELRAYCAKNRLDYVFTGSLTLDGDRQIYALSVYDRAKNAQTVNERAEGTSVLDVFEATDTLIQAVLGAVTGKHIGFGALAFTPLGSTDPYEVSIDDLVVPNSPRSIDYVTSGAHRLKVTRVSGDTPTDVLSMDINLPESATQTVSFFLESAPVAEAEPAPEELPTDQTPVKKTSKWKNENEYVMDALHLSPMDFRNEFGFYADYFHDLASTFVADDSALYSPGVGFAFKRRVKASSPFQLGGRLEGIGVKTAGDDGVVTTPAGLGVLTATANLQFNHFFSVSPELGLGAAFDASSFTAYPAIQGAFGLRFSGGGNKGCITFEIAQMVTVIPMPVEQPVFFGARAGFALWVDPSTK